MARQHFTAEAGKTLLHNMRLELDLGCSVCHRLNVCCLDDTAAYGPSVAYDHEDGFFICPDCRLRRGPPNNMLQNAMYKGNFEEAR